MQNSSAGATNPLLRSKFQSSKSIFILISRILLCEINTFTPPLHENQNKIKWIFSIGEFAVISWMSFSLFRFAYTQSKKLFLLHSLASYVTITLRNICYDHLLKGIPGVNELKNSVLGGFKGCNQLFWNILQAPGITPVFDTPYWLLFAITGEWGRTFWFCLLLQHEKSLQKE